MNENDFVNRLAADIVTTSTSQNWDAESTGQKVHVETRDGIVYTTGEYVSDVSIYLSDINVYIPAKVPFFYITRMWQERKLRLSHPLDPMVEVPNGRTEY